MYYRTGEGKIMASNGLLCDSYAFDQHVGRTNVLEFYKDDCRGKPYPTLVSNLVTRRQGAEVWRSASAHARDAFEQLLPVGR